MINILYIALIILGLLAIGNFFTYVIQDLFIFRPIKLEKDYEFDFPVPFDELTLHSPGNGQINAVWFHNEGEKRPVVLYTHGNSGNLATWADELCEYFDDLGYDLFMWDFRGFGKSKGMRTEAHFYSDAIHMYEFVRQFYEPKDIVIYGRSMGTGVSSMLAAEVEARVCILETPYHSIPSLFKSYYPFLPLFLFRFKYNFYSNEWVQEAHCDIYVFQGTRDTVVPYRCAIKLKPLLKDPSKFVVISGGKHSNLEGYDEYKDLMKQIMLNHN